MISHLRSQLYTARRSRSQVYPPLPSDFTLSLRARRKAGEAIPKRPCHSLFHLSRIPRKRLRQHRDCGACPALRRGVALRLTPLGKLGTGPSVARSGLLAMTEKSPGGREILYKDSSVIPLSLRRQCCENFVRKTRCRTIVEQGLPQWTYGPALSLLPLDIPIARLQCKNCAHSMENVQLLEKQVVILQLYRRGKTRKEKGIM
jgi:hypothetical protein